MSDWNDLVLFCVSIIMASCLGLFIGWTSAKTDMRVEAVKAGAAEWVVVDEHGNTEFRWKGAKDE